MSDWKHPRLFVAAFLLPLSAAIALAGQRHSHPPAATQTSHLDQPLAFPGAEGFAAHASGGRGGETCHVTNLNDSGSGSLRDACSKDHRTVVFDVGGYIDLRSALHISSDITIAGQSAPGEGIGTRGAEVSLSSSHNVIVRYMRFRQGIEHGETKKSAVAINEGSGIILDHVSIQFGRWDTVDMTSSANITIQYCIIGPGVSPQRFGCLCQSDGVTFSHNLWINNHSRNPKSKGKVQFINNVVYNWELDAYIEGASAGANWHDVIGNYFIAGPSSRHGPFARGNENTHIYARENYYDDNLDGKLNGRKTEDADLGSVTLLAQPFASTEAAPVSLDSADDAYRKIVADVGCALHRDSVDRHLIDDLTSLGKKGKIISDPQEMGGLGTLAGGAAPSDTDGDGIPDTWALSHHLNPSDPHDALKTNPAGYTMLEVYLNNLTAPCGRTALPSSP